MATGSELVTLFLGIELTAVSFYILVGFTRADKRSNEASLKYLLLGALLLRLYSLRLLAPLWHLRFYTELTAIASPSAAGAHDPFVILAVDHRSGGPSVQNFGGAVSCLGPRRVRRRTHARYRISVRGLENCGFAVIAPAAALHSWRSSIHMGTDADHCGGCKHHRRQHRRAYSEAFEAAVRL